MQNNQSLEVLNKWFEFTGFTGERKGKYTIDDFTYECEKGNLRINDIMSRYDSTGRLAVLYCKKLFDKVLLNKRYTAFDLFNSKRAEVESIREMYDLFNSDFILETEQVLINLFNTVFTQFMTTKMIGNSSKSDSVAFLSHLESVIDALFTMNFDLFLSGGCVGELNSFSTKILVVPTLTEALLKAESSPDGIYICYINGHNMEGYFTYILKSNGNILSVNDRVDEHYSGEHRRSRTGRWAENKQWNMFPYAEMVKFEERGYKGKDTTATVTGEMSIYELPEEAWMPLLVGAVLIYLRFKNKPIELPKKYVQNLQQVNLSVASSDVKALIVQDSRLVAQSQLNINFDLPSVLKDVYGKDFDCDSVIKRLGGSEKYYDKESGKGWLETGSFSNMNQFLVDLWGDGFEFDPKSLLATTVPLITNGEDSDTAPFQEMVGTESKMRLQAYFQVRKNLAEYMQKRINDNFIAFGGVVGVKAWFAQAVYANSKKVFEIIYKQAETAKDMGNWVSMDDIVVTKAVGDYNGFRELSLNDLVGDRRFSYRGCVVNGKECSIHFKISCYTWKGIETLVGGPLPKVIDGYVRHRNHDGNSNIDTTDLVSQVHTPMETWGSFSYNENEYHFDINVSFSKSGFNKFMKSGGSADVVLFIAKK